VIRVRDIPKEFLAVLSGHIHRFQVLTKDLRGQSIETPILYPGSIERTSFAEKDESKGYLKVNLEKNGEANQESNIEKRIHRMGRTHPCRISLSWEFVHLPSRPMVRVDITPHATTREALTDFIRYTLKELDPESVVKLNIKGQVSENALSVLRADSLRALTPSQMNVNLSFGGRTSRNSL
jgi:DNA repair exonuclease SbcCD nuclease subunit